VSSFEQWRSARPARLPAGLEALEDYIPQKVDPGVGSIAAGIDGDEYAGVELRCQTNDGTHLGDLANMCLTPRVLTTVYSPTRSFTEVPQWGIE